MCIKFGENLSEVIKEYRNMEFLITCEGVSKSFWAGFLYCELQMVQLSATRCSCITTLWVSI